MVALFFFLLLKIALLSLRLIEWDLPVVAKYNILLIEDFMERGFTTLFSTIDQGSVAGQFFLIGRC